MTPSISIVLPVHNAQQELPQAIAGLLEFLPELSARFEIVIVDDASTDQTEELARELAIEYPQIRLVRHSQPRGTAAAVTTGLEDSQGDFIFVQRQGAPLAEHEIRRLWRARTERNLVLARSTPAPLDSGLIERLMSWGNNVQQAATRAGDVQLIRRDALEQLRQLSAVYDAPEAPARRDTAPASQARRPREESIPERGGDEIACSEYPGAKENLMRRPSFLTRVKQFALGE